MHTIPEEVKNAAVYLNLQGRDEASHGDCKVLELLAKYSLDVKFIAGYLSRSVMSIF